MMDGYFFEETNELNIRQHAVTKGWKKRFISLLKKKNEYDKILKK